MKEVHLSGRSWVTIFSAVLTAQIVFASIAFLVWRHACVGHGPEVATYVAWGVVVVSLVIVAALTLEGGAAAPPPNSHTGEKPLAPARPTNGGDR